MNTLEFTHNQQNINHNLVRQTVTRHRHNVLEEIAWQLGAILEVIHTYTTELHINHGHMFILSPHQAQRNLICDMLV